MHDAPFYHLLLGNNVYIYIVYTYYVHIIMSAFILQSLHFVYLCGCVYVLRIAANFNVWNTRLFYPLYRCIYIMYVCIMYINIILHDFFFREIKNYTSAPTSRDPFYIATIYSSSSISLVQTLILHKEQ